MPDNASRGYARGRFVGHPFGLRIRARRWYRSIANLGRLLHVAAFLNRRGFYVALRQLQKLPLNRTVLNRLNQECAPGYGRKLLCHRRSPRIAVLHPCRSQQRGVAAAGQDDPGPSAGQE